MLKMRIVQCDRKLGAAPHTLRPQTIWDFEVVLTSVAALLQGCALVPRYYFDFQTQRQSRPSCDHIGTELPNLRAAKAEATTTAAEWLKDNAFAGSQLKLFVRNGPLAPLFVVTASIKVSAR